MTTESYVRRRAKQMGYTLIRSGHLDNGYALTSGDMITFGGVDDNGHVQMNVCRATLDQVREHMRCVAAFSREVERDMRGSGGVLPEVYDGRSTVAAVKAIMEKALRQ